MQNIFGAFKEMCSSCSLRFPLCCRFHTLWTYWFDYVWFTSSLRITKGKFDCAADLQFDPKSPIIHPSKSKKCLALVSLLFWFPICSIPTEELKALLHVLRTSWFRCRPLPACVSGNGGLSESPHQRCHPRLCRRSPPYLLSFAHSRARFWRSCSRGNEATWADTTATRTFATQFQTAWHVSHAALPSGIDPAWSLPHAQGNRNCQQLRFSYRQHCNRSAAWTCCSNLKLAAQAWILDMKRINLRQNLVSIHWTATSSQRFGLPWIYLNQSLPPKCEFKEKCVSTFHCRTCKSSKISFSLSPRVFAFGPIAIHDLHKYFRTKLGHSVNLFDSLWIES